MSRPQDLRQVRSFGLLVGGMFVVIGLWPPMLRGGPPRLWALVAGTVLVLPALAAPASLKPIHRIWMALAHGLGWVNTKVVLGVIFFGLITPVAFIRRLLRQDPLGRQFLADVETYRAPRQPRTPDHLRHQF